MSGVIVLATASPLLAAVLAAAPPTIAPAPSTWTLVEASAPPEAEPEPEPEPAPPPGEIVVEGEYGPPKSDPMERVNEESYRITQAVDQTVIEPIAYAYRDGLPGPVRDGLGNVVRNLGEPSNALNFLLQGKVGKAFETLGRLTINSTLGVGGLFDIAKKPGIALSYRRNGFANTLGYYGVGPGPYLYLPVTGATTVRDLAGRTLDQLLLPIVVGEPFNRTDFAVGYFLVNNLDQRLTFDAEIAAIRTTEDPYVLRRETYLAKRRADIAQLKGEPLTEEDARRLEELEALKQAPAEGAAAPPEPPADPESLMITRPR